jgi:tetraacyldisaccharide 4'-kinase
MSLGADVCEFRSYSDHHPYTRADVDTLREWAIRLPADAWVVTTQKDWVKLRIADLGGRPLWAVRVGLQFVEGGAEFNVAVLKAAGADSDRQ